MRKLEGEDLELALGALRSTRRIERLVEQLLAVSRLDAAGTREGVRVDLADVVLDVAEELECIARGHRVSIGVDAAPVCGVRDELHRLILNMIDNAVTHTPHRNRDRSDGRRGSDQRNGNRAGQWTRHSAAAGGPHL